MATIFWQLYPQGHGADLSSCPYHTTLQGIDKVFFYHEWRHHLQAYVTEPPLCGHRSAEDGASSTLEYDHAGSVAAVVGRLLRWARSLVASSVVDK